MASILAFLSTVVTILKSAPAIIAAIWDIIKFFKDAADKWEREQAKQDLKKAIETAKTTKDTSALENIFDPKNTLGVSFVAKEGAIVVVSDEADKKKV